MFSQPSTSHTRIGRALTATLTGALLCAAGGLVAAAPAAAAPLPSAPVTVTFTSVGETAFRVPPGVTSLHVVVIGGHGGRSFFGLGGSGARVEADLSVKPEDVLYADVAADGDDLEPGNIPAGEVRNPGSSGPGGAGGVGFGSGGGGSNGYVVDPVGGSAFQVGGGGGGGASAIVSCPAGQGSCSSLPLVVAAGGGGGGYNSPGGDAGTPDGADGGGSTRWITGGLSVTLLGGEGGHQDGPGRCGAWSRAVCPDRAVLRDGGPGGSDFGYNVLAPVGAGGGGGGYYGGGGGRSMSQDSSNGLLIGGGGGGGSSLVPAGGVATAGQDHGTALVSITYTPPDTTEPTLSTPDDLTVEATSARGAAVPFAVSGSDTTGAELAVTCDHASGAAFPLGRTDVTCSATGTNGITASRTFPVTVQDTTPPVIAGHDDVTATGTGNSTVVDYRPPTATDTVDGDVPVTCDPAPGSSFRQGTSQVSCAATDAAGNTGHASFVVSVDDSTPPAVITPGDLTAEATSKDGAVADFAVTAVDAAGAAAVVDCDHLSGGIFPIGATTVTCGATGGNGVASEGSFTITVRDTTPPVIAAQADVSISGSGPTVVDYATPGASDTVDDTVPVTCAPASGATFPVGATTVTCTATDAAGNSGNSTFTVRVTAPAIQVPGSPGIGTATAGNGSAAVAFTAPTSNGGAPVTHYLVTATPGGRTATGTAGPITVPGLTNGTSYRFTVQAINSAGAGAASALSNAITPAAPRADVRVTLTGPTSVLSGRPAEYTLRVTNVGPATAQGLTATLDTTALSRTTAVVAPASSRIAVSQFSPGDYRWTLRPLGPGASVTLRVTGTVIAGPGQPAGARGGASASTADPNPRNNTAVLSTRVTGR